jgi:hypothetical protein
MLRKSLDIGGQGFEEFAIGSLPQVVVELCPYVKTDGPSPEITDLRCPLFSDVLVHGPRGRGAVGMWESRVLQRDFQASVDIVL